MSGEETLAERLERAIKDNGLSYRRLGKLVNRTHGAIYNWAKKGVHVRDEDLARIAKVLGVTTAWLRYGGVRSTRFGALISDTCPSCPSNHS